MSDLHRINGKWYDFSVTNNPSFTETAKELKNLGIKNYYFMLEIKNPRVADIDPFKPNITNQEIVALMTEYKSNMWWFVRTAVRMRCDLGIVPYCLHRGLAAVLWNFLRHQDACICEPRQTYKTTGTIGGPILWAFQLSMNLHIHFFGKETDNTKRNLDHLKSNIELLPEWMQFKRYQGTDGKIKKSKQSVEILENGPLHNILEIHPKPSSISHAEGMGRGGSGAILYFDEIEFMPFFGIVMANSAPLFKTASDNAAKAGAPYGRIFSTTPGNLDTREGRDAYPIIQSMIPWTEKIYDMTEEEITEYKSAFKEEYNSSEEKHTREVIDVFYIEYQYYQVRKTYDWVQQQYALSGDKMAIRREILMQRLRGSTECPIDAEDIEYFISNMKKSEHEILLCHKWLFKLYSHRVPKSFGANSYDFDEEIPYLVGIDPSGGGGGDNFAITIVNPRNLQIAAEFKSPYLSGPAAVRMLMELVHDYIPKAVLIPERNSMGIYLIQMLLETDIRDNLYFRNSDRTLEEITEEDSSDRELQEMSAQVKKYGTYLGKKVRDAMLNLLFQHIAECRDILCTEYLVNDMCKLVRTSTGRIEASKGEHDDCLFSYLHTLYVFYTGDNLLRFGIDNSVSPVLSRVDLDDGNLNEITTEVTNTGIADPVSYEKIVIESINERESKISELRTTFSFYEDPLYHDSGPISDSPTVDIGAWFFDSINV